MATLKISQIPERLDLEFARGDTFPYEGEIEVHITQGEDEESVNLTGCDFDLRLETTQYGRLLAQGQVTTPEPASGVLRFKIDAGTTGALPSNCAWRLVMTWPDERKRTILYGLVRAVSRAS